MRRIKSKSLNKIGVFSFNKSSINTLKTGKYVYFITSENPIVYSKGDKSRIIYIGKTKNNPNRIFESLGTVVVDIPKESSYALLYNLAKVLGTWSHPLLEGAHPKEPYPIEFVKMANWRTTSEKISLLKNAGFTDLAFAQTLTWHPLYSDNAVEEPTDGYNRGDYVAICAYKNR